MVAGAKATGLEWLLIGDLNVALTESAMASRLTYLPIAKASMAEFGWWSP